jgi:hypothetical protein
MRDTLKRTSAAFFPSVIVGRFYRQECPIVVPDNPNNLDPHPGRLSDPPWEVLAECLSIRIAPSSDILRVCQEKVQDKLILSHYNDF